MLRNKFDGDGKKLAKLNSRKILLPNFPLNRSKWPISFCRIWPKMKTTIVFYNSVLISCASHIAAKFWFSSHKPNYACPIKLQDSLIINILRRILKIFNKNGIKNPNLKGLSIYFLKVASTYRNVLMVGQVINFAAVD